MMLVCAFIVLATVHRVRAAEAAPLLVKAGTQIDLTTAFDDPGIEYYPLLRNCHGDFVALRNDWRPVCAFAQPLPSPPFPFF